MKRSFLILSSALLLLFSGGLVGEEKKITKFPDLNILIPLEEIIKVHSRDWNAQEKMLVIHSRCGALLNILVKRVSDETTEKIYSQLIILNFKGIEMALSQLYPDIGEEQLINLLLKKFNESMNIYGPMIAEHLTKTGEYLNELTRSDLEVCTDPGVGNLFSQYMEFFGEGEYEQRMEVLKEGLGEIKSLYE